MLYTIAVVLIILWLLGLVSSYIMGGLIHVLLVSVQAKLNDAETTAKIVAENARKASAYAALWLFISLLIGAFCASLAVTYGGRRRGT